MCMYCVDSYNDTGKICRLYRQLNIPRTERPLNISCENMYFIRFESKPSKS